MYILNKISSKGSLIRKIERLLLQDLIKERGKVCEICRENKEVALFHIIPKSTHPRLRFYYDNLLLVCWNNCHFDWHNNPEKKKLIDERLKRLRGKDYVDKLRQTEVSLPKLTPVYLKELYFKLKEVDGGENNSRTSEEKVSKL